VFRLNEIKKQNREARFETVYFELQSDKRKKITDEENEIHYFLQEIQP
jgi:hypothetical protein